jgi:CheY-like chemotaxis protein
MRKFLFTQGLDGYTFDNGNAALEAIAEGDVGLVITGMTFSDMNGYDFIKRVKAISADIPIIALTSNNSGMELQVPGEYGIEAYIVKSKNWEQELMPYLNKYFGSF